MLCLYQKFLAVFRPTSLKSTCSSASWFRYCEKGLMFNRVLALWQGLLQWSKVHKAVPRWGTCTGSTEASQENKDCEKMGEETSLHVIIQLLYFSAHLTNAYEALWDSRRKSNPTSYCQVRIAYHQFLQSTQQRPLLRLWRDCKPAGKSKGWPNKTVAQK